MTDPATYRTELGLPMDLVDPPGLTAAEIELTNIRRLLERHGVPEADRNGVRRSTVGMVEEALLARGAPPR